MHLPGKADRPNTFRRHALRQRRPHSLLGGPPPVARVLLRPARLPRDKVRVLCAGRGRRLPALAYHDGARASRAHINAEEVHLCPQILLGLAQLHAHATSVNRPDTYSLVTLATHDSRT